MIEPRRTVDDAYLTTGTWEVEISGECYPAVVSARPLYDPKNERIRS